MYVNVRYFHICYDIITISTSKFSITHKMITNAYAKYNVLVTGGQYQYAKYTHIGIITFIMKNQM